MYRVSYGKRMFLMKTKLCEYFNRNFIMYIKKFTKLCHYVCEAQEGNSIQIFEYSSLK